MEQDQGPAIQFGGVTGEWMGSLYSNKNTVGIEARVNFETYTNERTMSFLEIGNSGTTVLYFCWKVFVQSDLNSYCLNSSLLCPCLVYYTLYEAVEVRQTCIDH